MKNSNILQAEKGKDKWYLLFWRIILEEGQWLLDVALHNLSTQLRKITRFSEHSLNLHSWGRLKDSLSTLWAYTAEEDQNIL